MVTHTIGYRSADNAGSLDTENTCTVKIDTTGSANSVGVVCAAENGTVKRGKSCRIYYRVDDAKSAQVTQRLTMTTKSGVVQQRWQAHDGENCDGWWYVKYTCRRSKGSYRIVVSGEDLVGNSASAVGRAILTGK